MLEIYGFRIHFGPTLDSLKHLLLGGGCRWAESSLRAQDPPIRLRMICKVMPSMAQWSSWHPATAGQLSCWWHIRLAIWNASFHHFIAGGTWLFLNLKRCQESGGPKSHRVWYFMFWHKEYLFNRTQIWAEVEIWQQIVSYTSASVFLAQSLILMHDSIMTTISFSLAYASTN